MILITALTSGLSGNLFSYVLGVNAQSADITSPEAMLTIEYPAGTLLSTAITGIKSQLPNKNL